MSEQCCNCPNVATGFFNRSTMRQYYSQRVHYCDQVSCQIAALALLVGATMNDLPKRGDGAVA